MFHFIADVATASYRSFFADNGDDRGHSKPVESPTRPSYEPAQPPVRQRPTATDSSQKDQTVPPSEGYESPPAQVKQEGDVIPTMPYLIAGLAGLAAVGYATYQIFANDGDERDHSKPAGPPLSQRYESLRSQAKQEGDLMSKCYGESKAAYERRDRALAKTLSDQGKFHKTKMEEFHAEASAIIFQENNKNREADEVDLHNLSVSEAITYAKKAVARARQEGFPEIRLIVGRGNHSDGGLARIKPAVQDTMQECGYSVAVDPHNPGALVVSLPVDERW